MSAARAVVRTPATRATAATATQIEVRRVVLSFIGIPPPSGYIGRLARKSLQGRGWFPHHFMSRSLGSRATKITRDKRRELAHHVVAGSGVCFQNLERLLALEPQHR